MFSVHSIDSTYRGRFAPTPSGPLHLGSLATALASYLEARRNRGLWLLRIDDLDAPRCPPGVDSVILRQLEDHALQWDGAPRYQHQHVAEYEAVLTRLRQRGHLYCCDCTRATLKRMARAGPDGPVYPGICRQRRLSEGSLRLRLGVGEICLDDPWQQRPCRQRADQIGDFVVRRADGRIAYQLACVVDEQAQGITEVIRGVDLLGSTFQQLCVHEALGLQAPRYRHLPVVVDARGRKLSKQNRAPAIDGAHAAANLLTCLDLLRQSPPRDALARAPAEEIVAWATAHWDAATLPRTAQIEGAIAYNALQQSSQ